MPFKPLLVRLRALEAQRPSARNHREPSLGCVDDGSIRFPHRPMVSGRKWGRFAVSSSHPDNALASASSASARARQPSKTRRRGAGVEAANRGHGSGVVRVESVPSRGVVPMDVRRFAVRLLAGIGLLSSSLVGLAQQPPETFEVEETTIRQIHAALRSRTLTCRELVERYLARIRAYEDGGPRLNSITTVNPRALELAASLDGELERTGELRELHCVPVLLKDNINTADMPTSSGSALLKDAVPAADATLVAALREAGAIVFGKAALGELAAGSYNTIDGQQL